MTDKEMNRKIYGLAYDYLLDHLPEGMTERKLKKYFLGDSRKASSLKAVFRQFIFSAQNYQGMPKFIKLFEREAKIKKILYDYDYNKISRMDVEKLYHTFRKTFKVTSTDSKRNSWYKWSRSVVDSAKFISGFKSMRDFSDFVSKFDYNTETRIALPLLISTRISGIGFALACDLLKELGYLNYPKPDVHLIDICTALNIVEDNSQISTFESIVKMADDNEVTPYQVDKVLWLICSGRYHMDHDAEGNEITTKRHKADFIEYAKAMLV